MLKCILEILNLYNICIDAKIVDDELLMMNYLFIGKKEIYFEPLEKI